LRSNIRKEKKNVTVKRFQKGQAAVEYVIMLAMILLLAFALASLNRAICSQGERMVKIAAYNVP
jgi:cytochrome c oxidase assembly protein Cox11